MSFVSGRELPQPRRQHTAERGDGSTVLVRTEEGASGRSLHGRRVRYVAGQYAHGNLKTKTAAVTLALHEFIARRERRRLLELFDSLDWDPTFDYQAERSRG